MVRAILEGRKTQMRRIVKPQPEDFEPGEGRWKSPIKCEYYNPLKVDRYGEEYPGEEVFGFADESEGWVCPYGASGDRFWVRETWKWEGDTKFTDIDPIGSFYYKVDDVEDIIAGWKSSRFMPKLAARLFLEITNIRVERVQNISEDEAKAEGVFIHKVYPAPRMEFANLWDSIHKKENRWNDNPWVWVIEFKRQ